MVSAKKNPNSLAFHCSPHGSLVAIGQHFVTTRIVHLPKRTETSLITEADLITGPDRTRLRGPCIAAIAGFTDYLDCDGGSCFKVGVELDKHVASVPVPKRAQYESYVFVCVLFVKFKQVAELQRGDCRPYRRTNHTLSHLYHDRPCTLGSSSC